MRQIPQAAIDLVRDQEETHLFAYDDGFYPARQSKPGDEIHGTLTAGTGHTGSDVTIGMTVTQAMNDQWILDDLASAARKIDQQIGVVIDALTENQWAALLDFVFNAGAKPSWTIWKRLRAKKFDQVPIEMQRFVNITKKDGTTVKSTDLIERRALEVKLWATGEPGTDPAPVSSGTTRQAGTTPPTPTDPVPATRSKAIIGGIGAAITLGPTYCDQMIHVIAPYAEHSSYVEKMLAGLGTIGAVLAAVSLTYMLINKRNARN